MDPSKYKVPKREPINYGPKVKPIGHTTRPSTPSQKLVRSTTTPPPPQPTAAQSRPAAVSATPVAAKSVNYSPVEPIQKPRPSYKNVAPVAAAPAIKLKKRRKPRKHIKIVLICLIILVVLGASAAGGYYYYIKKYKPSHLPVSQNTQDNTSTPVSKDPILNADYIVYGLKEGSLFTTNRADYVQDSAAPIISVIAKASSATDARQLVISQQKVTTNFATNPNGLKKMADGIGSNTSITTKAGTSYIITGNATGLAAIGTTLINIRATVALAATDWQQLFDSLEPLTI